jgi:uroporphyrinogen decarboxylase
MAYDLIKEDVLSCISLKEPSKVPFFPIGVMFDYMYAGYTNRAWRESPDIMTEVGAKVIEDFDYDIYMLHPDDLVEYEDIGITITNEEDFPPAVREYLPASVSTLNSLRLPDNLMKKGRAALYIEGLKNLKREFGDRVFLVSRIAAPFTAVTLLLGIDETLIMMIENPALLRKYMDFLLEYNDAAAQAELEAGADGIWLGDCVATSHFISPGQYSTFAAEYAAASAERIRKREGVVFYHGNEKSIEHLEIMSGLPFDAINIGEGVDIGKVKNRIGSRICIMGNMDTINDLQPKTPSQVENIVGEMVSKAKSGGGYIFCTGEGVPHHTPKENILAMSSSLRNHGSY